MKRPKHVPQRTCIACRSVRSKGDLLRIVRTPQGVVEVDSTGKAAGRGAYICRSEACAETAVRQKKLVRALGMDAGEAILEKIKEVIDWYGANRN